MFLRLILLIAVILPSSSHLWGQQEEHKIVYLISGPRALSTVFLRMMESRGDFAIFHEPTVPLFSAARSRDYAVGWFRSDSFKTWEEIKAHIYSSQVRSHVFVKDMSFAAHPHILHDPSFMEDPSIHFLFLVRDPHHTSISFYLTQGGVVEEMSNFIGLRTLYELYEAIQSVNPHGAKIIFSEQLYTAPRETLAALCHTLDIPFSERAFHWEQHDRQFTGHNEWHDQKAGDHLHHWHGRAIQSTHIEMPNSYHIDAMGNPTFIEIADEEARLEMIEVYLENLIYYEKFLNAREDHLVPLEGDLCR